MIDVLHRRLQGLNTDQTAGAGGTMQVQAKAAPSLPQSLLPSGPPPPQAPSEPAAAAAGPPVPGAVATVMPAAGPPSVPGSVSPPPTAPGQPLPPLPGSLPPPPKAGQPLAINSGTHQGEWKSLAASSTLTPDALNSARLGRALVATARLEPFMFRA